MKVAIMQPYLFPYIGYWQLVGAVDEFVVLDDVNFIMRGYINRNTIMVGGEPHRFSLELQGASQNKRINEIELGANAGKILRTIEYAYKRAPYFDRAFPVLERAMTISETNLARFVTHSIVAVSGYLGLQTRFQLSSDLGRNELRGQDRILRLCADLGASDYINPIGGVELYDRAEFANAGINLSFLRPHVLDAGEPGAESRYSIVHLMMHHSPAELQQRLADYSLV